MNIIIGDVAANSLRENYTVLELETFTVGENRIKTYCVVNNIPLQEISMLAENKILHQQMIDEYNSGNLRVCVDLIAVLRGKFGGELDTFYETLTNKINNR